MNTIAKTNDATVLVLPFRFAAQSVKKEIRPEILIEDWNREGYAPWTAEGTAFGKGPILRGDVPAYQGDLGGEGSRVVNSHASASGDSVEARDANTGKLTGLPFPIDAGFHRVLDWRRLECGRSRDSADGGRQDGSAHSGKK